MKTLFSKLNFFLLTTISLGIIVISIFIYYLNTTINFYNYLSKIYNTNTLALVNKFFIFNIGIIGSIWTYINYKRTNNIQFVFFYCFICFYIIEPIAIFKYYLLSNTLSLELYSLMKFYHLIVIFSLLNLFFLSLYICDFQIKSITYTIYLIFTFSMIYSYLIPINAYQHTNDFFSPIKNNKLYIYLFLLLILINFLVACLRKKNLSYLLLFVSTSLIVLGTYLNLIEIPYAFIPISIGVPIYLQESGKLFFYWL
ncbi:hypothetical protein ACE4V3_02255 [Borrelia recurrentis]|uniref:Uncharacterized conserved protein n=1 Tax=Borrelia recurrentis (strain A1) TaxID=412418 RepID=B5RRL7_BORRA|nr:uncharacterized conserved protein [Borrelia recurrentis A1]